ncbi:MAG: preprotein translocase subunit SecE [Lachnospiraceae bacterium]
MGDSSKEQSNASSENKSSSKKKKPGFLKGLKKEFKKIIWPTKEEATKQTISVVVISLVVGAIIALLDTVVQYGVNWLTTF